MPQGERIIRPVWSAMAPLPRDVFFSPLEAVRLEHNRQLKVSEWILERVSDQRIEHIEESVDELLGFFCQDLVLHHKDEEDDLIPRLQERCGPQDSADAILAELIRDHASESFLMRDIVADLHRVVELRDLESPRRFFQSLRCFAEGQKRHIFWENEVILPLAKLRLTDIDLMALGSSMVARRSDAHPNRK